jgi:hypothetical protein
VRRVAYTHNVFLPPASVNDCQHYYYYYYWGGGG